MSKIQYLLNLKIRYSYENNYIQEENYLNRFLYIDIN